jgi:hypothetical protein
VQRTCQLARANGNGKSLKVKEDRGKARDTLFQRPIARDDLDVSVKTSPPAADKPNSRIPRRNVFYLLKTGWIADFPGKPR